jgi:hypothetical protein
MKSATGQALTLLMQDNGTATFRRPIVTSTTIQCNVLEGLALDGPTARRVRKSHSCLTVSQPRRIKAEAAASDEFQHAHVPVPAARAGKTAHVSDVRFRPFCCDDVTARKHRHATQEHRSRLLAGCDFTIRDYDGLS